MARAMITLREIDPAHLKDVVLLWQLLLERPAAANISHQKMPTWEEHTAFVASKPYRVWYAIEKSVPPILEPILEKVARGAIYLTKQNEIGIAIRKVFQRQGYAREAIQILMKHHGPGPYKANIAPRNAASIALFTGLGARHIQNTYQF
jgi:RimJ/RimL family protein N-acetyltransferase